MLKNKWVKVFLGCLFLFIASLIGYISWVKINANALWNIVNEQCLSPQKTVFASPSSCLKVDKEKHYVLFKDKQGPRHNLVIPTSTIAGIESPQLLEPSSPDYFAIAWQERESLLPKAGTPFPHDLLAVAVNSPYGRSQNQLHLHIACLKPEVSLQINQVSTHITTDWATLPTKLIGHHYLAKKLQDEPTKPKNAFNQLNEYVEKHQDKMSNFGLALIQLTDGSKVLLANRVNIWDLNLGSAGELLDYQCVAANQ
ncbi:CDP-diacylglycerol diphosphatase [Providencia rettgeri]|uniref:CDP-diacylglycerol diphosphatase n=1 Tax=Providencia rettgeri TaxID=587 RepID=UPI0034E0A58D